MLGAAAVFVASSRTGRELVDDVLRGAGIGTLVGTAVALALWAADQLPGG